MTKTKTKKLTFTQAAIAKLPKPQEGRAYYADAKTPGLYLAVWDTGVKTFELYKRMGGRPTRLKIGRFSEITVQQARDEVHRMTGQMAEGHNPADDRRKARGETTVGELFGMYMELHARPRKRTWQGDQAQFDRYLAPWKTHTLSSIKRADVASLHNKIGADHPYSANRLLAMLSAMFNFASDQGYEGPNPAKGIKRFKEQSRTRFLRGDEIQRFFQALRHEETPELWRDFFALSLLTGARRGNMESMKWADLDLEHGEWRIPESESKNKEPLLVVLAPEAVEFLNCRDDANKGQDKPSEYVFPSFGKTGHVTELKNAWKRIMALAEIKDCRAHDLRRTHGSWQAANGTSLAIIGKSLGHKNIATTQIYARLDLGPVKVSVHAAAAAMMAAAKGKPKQHKALPAPTR